MSEARGLGRLGTFGRGSMVPQGHQAAPVAVPKQDEKPRSGNGRKPRAWKAHPEAFRIEVDHGARRINLFSWSPAEDARAMALTHGRVVDALLAKARQTGARPTFPEYVAAMQHQGVRVVPRIKTDADGRMEKLNGLSFSTASITLLASDIAADGKKVPMAWSGLQEAGIDCDLARDRELIENLASWHHDLIKGKAQEPVRHEGERETLEGLFVHGIDDEDRKANAEDIKFLLEKGIEKARAYEVVGDPKSGHGPFYMTVLVAQRRVKDDDGKWRWEPDPGGAAKVFSAIGNGEYKKSSYSKAGTFKIHRLCCHMPLAEAVRHARDMNGFLVNGDPLDFNRYRILDRRLQDHRRKSRPEANPLNREHARIEAERRQALLRGVEAKIAAAAKALPVPAEVLEGKQTQYDRDEAGDIYRALAHARMVGFDLPAVIASRDDEMAVEDWLREELGKLKRLPKPSEIGCTKFQDDKWRLVDDSTKLRFLTKGGLADVTRWLATNRLSSLAEGEGYHIVPTEGQTATIVERDQNWIGMDIDKFKTLSPGALARVPEWAGRFPNGFDTLQRPEEFARWWVEAFMPEEFQGAAFYWQQSSSAGWEDVPGKEKVARFSGDGSTGNFHLFFELDGFHAPKLVGDYIEACLKSRLCDFIECGVIEVPPKVPGQRITATNITGGDGSGWKSPVQALYCCPSTALDESGVPQPDRLGDKRDGVAAGARQVALPVDLSTEKLNALIGQLDAKLEKHGIVRTPTAKSEEERMEEMAAAAERRRALMVEMNAAARDGTASTASYTINGFLDRFDTPEDAMAHAAMKVGFPSLEARRASGGDGKGLYNTQIYNCFRDYFEVLLGRNPSHGRVGTADYARAVEKAAEVMEGLLRDRYKEGLICDHGAAYIDRNGLRSRAEKAFAQKDGEFPFAAVPQAPRAVPAQASAPAPLTPPRPLPSVQRPFREGFRSGPFAVPAATSKPRSAAGPSSMATAMLAEAMVETAKEGVKAASPVRRPFGGAFAIPKKAGATDI